MELVLSTLGRPMASWEGKSEAIIKALEAADRQRDQQRRLPSASTTLLEGKFRLMDLPPEILQMILLHVIDVPWHPAAATFPHQAVTDLLRAEALHVNRYLRQLAINEITRRCLWLWVTIEYEPQTPAQALLRDLGERLPRMAGCHAKTLTNTVYGLPATSITASFGKRGNLSLNDHQDAMKHQRTFVLPFNYQSWADIYTTMIKCAEIRWLPTYFTFAQNDKQSLESEQTKVFQEQIVPISKLLATRGEVEVFGFSKETFFCLSKYQARSMASPRREAAEDILAVHELMKQLDNNGHSLEASLLCLYTGQIIREDAPWSLSMQSTPDWLIDDVSVNAQEIVERESGERIYNASHVNRMRLIRNFHHIEHRAALCFIDGLKRYGLSWLEAHHSTVAEGTDGRDLFQRWMYSHENLMWFGLPDFEQAQILFVRSQLRSVVSRYIQHLNMSPDLGDDAMWNSACMNGIEAVNDLYRAWRLDKQNPKYCALLADAALNGDVIERVGLQQLRDWSSEENVFKLKVYNPDEFARAEYWELPDVVVLDHPEAQLKVFGGHFQTIDHWEFNYTEIDFKDISMYVKKVARHADVTYDSRRDDELPPEFEDSEQIWHEPFITDDKADFTWLGLGDAVIEAAGVEAQQSMFQMW